MLSLVEYFKTLDSSEPTLVINGETLEIIAANGQLCELIGRSFSEVVGKKIDFFIPATNASFNPNKRNQPVKIIRKDGQELEAQAVCLFMQKGPPLVAVLRFLREDTSPHHIEAEMLQNRHLALQRAHKELLSAYNRLELLTDELENKNRKLEELYGRLSYASRMATIGELTAGAAHGINNPLAAAVSAIRGLNRLINLVGDENLRENLLTFSQRADKALERIEKIVNDLRRLARVGNKRGELKEVSLAQEIKMALDLLADKLREVEVVTAIPQTTVRVCPEEFLQVLMNLFDNAVYAMGGKGRLEIKGETKPEGLYLRVSDSGPGIPEEIRDRIFEPFFTSKPPGEGTGMGLPMARSIVESYAGSLNLAETNGPGSTFVIFLPKEVAGV
jgi:two-component system NtrC family sensor kinase